jgi:hypothetical protein
LAISHQARNCIDYILSQNPKVESFLINRKFSCPISVAIRRNDIETIRALVELDRFQHIVNTKVHKSLSYIHLAVEKNRHEIADILLYHGAHVNLQDNNGNTPAHFVNDIPTLRVLISHGARLELGNRNNETPIMAAEKDGRNAVYQYLRLYNHENRKKAYKTLDTRFYYNNSDRIEKAIAAMNIMSDETSQKGNYEDMPDLEEIPPIKHIPIPPRKVNENIYPTRTEMSRLDDGAPSLKLRNQLLKLLLRALACSCVHWRALACTGVLLRSLACSSVNWRALECTGVLWLALACSGVHWRTLV